MIRHPMSDNDCFAPVSFLWTDSNSKSWYSTHIRFFSIWDGKILFVGQEILAVMSSICYIEVLNNYGICFIHFAICMKLRKIWYFCWWKENIKIGYQFQALGVRLCTSGQSEIYTWQGYWNAFHNTGKNASFLVKSCFSSSWFVFFLFTILYIILVISWSEWV